MLLLLSRLESSRFYGNQTWSYNNGTGALTMEQEARDREAEGQNLFRFLRPWPQIRQPRLRPNLHV